MAGPAAPTDNASSAGHNFVLRVLSALVLAPLALATAFVGSWPFALFWTLAALAVLWEWITLAAGPGHRLMLSSSGCALALAAFVQSLSRPVVALALIVLGAFAAAIFAPRERRMWVVGGVAYAGTLMLAPLILRADEDYGLAAILFLFATVWTTDVFAYIAGRAIGGPKLCPAVSPKKTWSGAIAGSLGAVVVTMAGAHFFDSFNLIGLGLVAFILSVVAQIGDLIESAMKRRFGAKDASQLIPGHGGVMDRVDGFWAAAVVGCLIGLARGGFADAAHGLLIW